MERLFWSVLRAQRRFIKVQISCSERFSFNALRLLPRRTRAKRSAVLAHAILFDKMHVCVSTTAVAGNATENRHARWCRSILEDRQLKLVPRDGQESQDQQPEASGGGHSSRGFSLADLTGRLGSTQPLVQHSTEKKAAKAALVFEDRNDPTSSQRIIPEVLEQIEAVEALILRHDPR
jgi:hypothetical protein